MERPERDDRLRAVRETIDVLVGQGERGLKGVLRASLLLKMEKGGAEMVEEGWGRERAAGGFSAPAADPAKTPFAGSPENNLSRAGHASEEAWDKFVYHRQRPFYDRCVLGSMHVGGYLR